MNGFSLTAIHLGACLLSPDTAFCTRTLDTLFSLNSFPVAQFITHSLMKCMFHRNSAPRKCIHFKKQMAHRRLIQMHFSTNRSRMLHFSTLPFLADPQTMTSVNKLKQLIIQTILLSYQSEVLSRKTRGCHFFGKTIFRGAPSFMYS